MEGRKNRAQAKPWQLYNLATNEKETTSLTASYPCLPKRFDEIVQEEHREAIIDTMEFRPRASTATPAFHATFVSYVSATCAR